MCGIFGIVARNGRIPDGLVERGTRSLAHRGPDDSGTVLLRSSSGHDEVGLGNCRLAILDLSPLGHQPMADEATGNWIVYNGEIYNFRDIRKELEESGTGFVSNSDTEVVLKAYARWGETCLKKFRGMFAFALWDAKQQSLWIARDPMGIKPLYYAHSGEYFLFSSEVRSLLGTSLVRKKLDSAGLVNFLTFGSSYDPLTPIEGVRSLPAGHTLTWQAGVVAISQYWDLIDKPEEPAFVADEKSVTLSLQPLLEEAVRMQLVSDVPVGVFLSGGIDSSALVGILSRAGVKASTFSIVFREAEFSEADYSRAIARHFHTDHYEITVSQSEVLASIPAAMGAMDLPTMDGINTYFVSQKTRRAGVKVALSGLGGDEVFAGYSSFRTVPRMERFAYTWNRLPAGMRRPFASAWFSLSASNDKNRKLASLARDNGRVLHPYFLTRMLFMPDQRDQLLAASDPMIEKLAMSAQRNSLQRTQELDPVNRVSYLESRCYMLNTLLRDADFMSMSQGLEVRVPLIDHQLAAMILALPGAWKLNGTPKKLLVDSMAGLLPNEIVCRKKRGFTLPFERWLREDLRGELESVLAEKRIGDGPLGGLLRPNAVRGVWNDFLRGSVSWSRPWSLFVLQRWCELHL